MYAVVERLDDLGRPAWIAVMVLSFILFWPVGLAVLAYLIWSGRMACGRHGEMSRWQARMAEKWQRKAERHGFAGPFSRTGNRAFDEYREDTLRRLEEESREFHSFLDKLRMAKDKAEFDAFMAERRSRPQGGEPGQQAPQS